MLECHVAFVWFDRASKKYVPVADGLKVEVVDRDVLSGDDVLGTGTITGGKGACSIRVDDNSESEPDIYFRLYGFSAEVPVWSSLNTWSIDHHPGLLDNFGGSKIGEPAKPLTFRVTFDCFVRFVRWDEDAGEFTGVPEGIKVEAVDANVFKDRVLGSALTDHRGRVHIRLAHDHEKNPDLYFRYHAPDLPEGLPKKFSTKERFAVGAVRRAGYLENFKGSRVGAWGSPYAFDVTAERPRYVPNNRVKPLIDGPAIYEAMIALIDGAQHHLHGEVMLFFNDPYGHRIKEALLRAAKRGVEVRLLFDAFTTANSAQLVVMKRIWTKFLRKLDEHRRDELLGELDKEEKLELVRGDTKQIRDELEQVSGLELKDTSFDYVELDLEPEYRAAPEYQQLYDAKPFFSIARIDHRKIFIADGKIALLGGANVGQEYLYEKHFDPAVSALKEEWVKWHDCFVELEGPVVRDLQRLFRERWLEEGGARFSTKDKYFPAIEPVKNGADVCIVNTTPGARMQVHAETLELIDTAKREIWIENPYFSTGEIKERLIEAAKRGVRVVFVFPDRHNDSYDFLYAARLKYRDLIRGGIEVYEYQNHMTHAKVAIFDDLTVIGSANLNRASFFKHYEVQALIRDRAVTEGFKRDMFQRDLAASVRIHEADLEPLLDINTAAELWVRGVVDRLF